MHSIGNLLVAFAFPIVGFNHLPMSRWLQCGYRVPHQPAIFVGSVIRCGCVCNIFNILGRYAALVSALVVDSFVSGDFV